MIDVSVGLAAVVVVVTVTPLLLGLAWWGLISGAPDRSGRPRFRGTRAARWTAVVLICVAAGAIALLVLGPVLDPQRYGLLLPLATWHARSVLVLATPLALGLAWWLLISGTPPRSVRPGFRGTPAARWTAVVLVCIAAGAIAVLVLAAVLDQQRYVLLLPLATWRGRAIVVLATPLLLGLAWWLLISGTPPRSVRPRFRGTRAARWTGVVLVGVAAVAMAALVFGSVLDRQRYLYHPVPLSSFDTKAVLVAATPLLLGLAWWLLTGVRLASIVCVVTTVLVQEAAVLAGHLMLSRSYYIEEIPREGPEVIAVSPDARFTLVRTVHEKFFGGSYELLRVRSRAGLASRESAKALMRCDTDYYGYGEYKEWHVITGAEVSFINETTVEITASGTRAVVRFDPQTLRVDRTVEFDVCPHLIQSG